MANVFHGDQQTQVGVDNIVWGFADQGIDFRAGQHQFHRVFDAEYPSGALFRVWTGVGELNLENQTYTGIGPDAVSVSGQMSSSNSQDSRMQITIRAVPRALRAQLINAPPLITVTSRIIHSADDGRTWNIIPIPFTGVISNTVLHDGHSYTFDIVARVSDIDRGRPAVWGNQFHQSQNPGDLGFEHMATLADGHDFKWPPLG